MKSVIKNIALFFMNIFGLILLLFSCLSLKWPAGTTYYNINCIIGSTSDNTVDWSTYIENAANSWNGITNNISIVRAGNGCTTTGQNTWDNINVVTMGSMQGYDLATQLAEAIKTTNASTGDILDVDIVFNQDYLNDFKNSSVKVQSIALHEFGHFLGLNHSSNTNDIMYSTYTGILTPSSNDRITLINLYATQTSQEPPQNKKPCASGIILMHNPFELHLLPHLRTFRDKVLAKSASGRKYIDAYYKFSPEIIHMATTHPLLLFHTASLISKYAELLTIDDIHHKSSQAISTNDIEKIIELLGEYSSIASKDLSSILQGIRIKIQSRKDNTIDSITSILSQD